MAKPGPTGKLGEQRVERDIAELADDTQLDVAEAETQIALCMRPR